MFEKIIEHQVKLIMQEKGLINALGRCEILDLKYQIALKLLNELGADKK